MSVLLYGPCLCPLEVSFLLVIMATSEVGLSWGLFNFHSLFPAEQFGGLNTAWIVWVAVHGTAKCRT